MTPVISPWVFYAISLVDGLEVIFTIGIVFAIVAIAIVGILVLCEFENEGEVTNRCKKFIKIAKYLAVILAILIAFCVFVPNSNTITKMITAQNVTYERIEVATDTVQEVYEDFMELFGEEIK